MMPIRPDPDPQHWVNKKNIPSLMATRHGTYTTKQIIVVNLNCRVPDPDLTGKDTEHRIPRIMSSDAPPDPNLDIFFSVR